MGRSISLSPNGDLQSSAGGKDLTWSCAHLKRSWGGDSEDVSERLECVCWTASFPFSFFPACLTCNTTKPLLIRVVVFPPFLCVLCVCVIPLLFSFYHFCLFSLPLHYFIVQSNFSCPSKEGCFGHPLRGSLHDDVGLSVLNEERVRYRGDERKKKRTEEKIRGRGKHTHTYLSERKKCKTCERASLSLYPHLYGRKRSSPSKRKETEERPVFVCKIPFPAFTSEYLSWTVRKGRTPLYLLCRDSRFCIFWVTFLCRHFVLGSSGMKGKEEKVKCWSPRKEKK